MRKALFAVLVSFSLTAFAAQPMTAKDVALMVRMGVPEADIFAEAAKRRLIAPIDAAAESTLTASGATPAFIQKLRAANYSLSPEEAAAAAQRMTQQRAAAAEQEKREAEAKVSAAPATLPPASSKPFLGITPRAILPLLEGKLVKLRGDKLVPVEPGELKGTRYFAFYNSAMWCAPCRKFTPKLIEFYQKTKPAHPEFEVIFLSKDRDEYNMGNYMRTEKMPWPAVRFGEQYDLANDFCGTSIPWLVVVNELGLPLTPNGFDMQYMDPKTVLTFFTQRFLR